MKTVVNALRRQFAADDAAAMAERIELGDDTPGFAGPRFNAIRIDAYRVELWCPRCKTWHSHHAQLGHCRAGCEPLTDRMSFKNTGYVIAVIWPARRGGPQRMHSRVTAINREAYYEWERVGHGVVCPICRCWYSVEIAGPGSPCGDLSAGQLDPCPGILDAGDLNNPNDRQAAGMAAFRQTQRGYKEVLEMPSAIVRLHRNNKSSALSTNASSEDEFVRELVSVLAAEMGLRPKDNDGFNDQDSIDLLHAVQPQIIDIACKLRGYKSSVTEHRVLVAGAFIPEDVVESFSAFSTHHKELVDA